MQCRRPDLAALEEVAGDHERVRLALDGERADAREGLALGGSHARPDTGVEACARRVQVAIRGVDDPQHGCRSLVRRSVVAGSRRRCGLASAASIDGTLREFETIRTNIVTRNPDYKVLVLSSDPATLDELTGIANEHFADPAIIYWEMGNTETKPAVLEQIEATPYNLVISYINGIILQRRHLERAHFGALNIHPAPPEHGGAFGIWCQPVIRRDIRTHHGVTAHEMDESIDHGPIYRVERWDVEADATIQSVVDRTSEECLALCATMAERLAGSPDGTRSFERIADTWHPTNRHHSVADVRDWFDGARFRASGPSGAGAVQPSARDHRAAVLRRSLISARGPGVLRRRTRPLHIGSAIPAHFAGRSSGRIRTDVRSPGRDGRSGARAPPGGAPAPRPCEPRACGAARSRSSPRSCARPKTRVIGRRRAARRARSGSRSSVAATTAPPSASRAPARPCVACLRSTRP